MRKKLIFSCIDTSSRGDPEKHLLRIVLKKNIHSWEVILKTKSPPTDASLRKELVRTLASAWDRENNTSKTEEWRALSSWRGKKIPFVGVVHQIVHTENLSKDGFADPLGMKSPRLDFVTYAEAFFATEQTNLKCRTLAKFRYLKKLFPDYHGTQEQRVCQTVDDWISPAEVDSLELLISSATSSAPESVAGHLMLRVKKKWHPESGISRETEDPDDPVLSIVANVPRFVGALEMMIHGVTGEYPSTIDVLRLGDVIMNSTYLEDRDVRRFRLNLSPEQIRSILERLYETRQTMTYSYTFFTNNCATLMIKQIATALGDHSLLNETDSVGTPDTFTEAMIRRGYAEQTFPTFYSRSRNAEVSRFEQKKLLAKYLDEPGTPFTDELRTKIESPLPDERAKGYFQLRDTAILSTTTPEMAFDIYLWLSLQGKIEDAWEMEKYLKDHDLFKSPYNEVMDTVYKNRNVLEESPNPKISELADLRKVDFLTQSQNLYAKESDRIAWQYEKKILDAEETKANREQNEIATRQAFPVGFIKKIHSADTVIRTAAYHDLILMARSAPRTATEDILRFVAFMYPFERKQVIQQALASPPSENPDFNFHAIFISFYEFKNVLKESSDPYLQTLPSLDRDVFFTRLSYWRHARLTDDKNYSWIADVTFNFGKYEIEEIKKRQLELAAETGLDPAFVHLSWELENEPRQEGYRKILDKFTTARGADSDKLFLILLHSWRVENEIFTKKGNQIHQANQSLETLRRVKVQVIQRSRVKGFAAYEDRAERTRLTDAQILEKDHEIAEAQIGTARTGMSPVTISAGTAVMNWKGVYQMTLDGGEYAQSIGDPSRFIIGKNNIAIHVMPSRLVLTMDPGKGLDLSGSGTFLDFVKTAEKYGHPQTIFEGKLGLSMRVLEYDNSRWTDRPNEWTWINPNVVATLAATQDFKNFLNVSLGAEVGNSWIVNTMENSHPVWGGVPLRVESQVTFGKMKRGQISFEGEYIPRWNFMNATGMDQFASATLTGTWHLTNIRKAEVRLKIQTRAEYYRYREYLLMQQKDPAVLHLNVGVNIRSK